MKIKFLLFEIILVTVTVFLLSGYSSASNSDKILTTDNFIINYKLKNSSCAFAFAKKLESSNDLISSFLGIELSDKINVFISNDWDESISEIIKKNISNEIYISSGANFNITCTELYNKIFQIYLQKILHDGKGNTGIAANLLTAIKSYPEKNRDLIQIFLNDMVNIENISSIDFKTIDRYNLDQQHVIYTIIVDFIISNYGRKILTQSLKDTDYYNGFFESLSKITGDPIPEITENINRYIKRYKSDSLSRSEIQNILFQENDGFSDISYSVRENEQAAILQKNKSEFRLLLKTGNNDRKVILKRSEDGSFFNNITFLESDLLAIIEIFESGSSVQLYDIKANKITHNVFIPLLFISNINSYNNKIIFSATSGLKSDIYTLSIITGEFNILTESGDNYSPVAIKNKVYFVSTVNRSSIMESDSMTGEIKTVFSTDQKISNLNQFNEKIITFSFELNGIDEIFILDPISGNFRQLTGDNTSKLAPLISGKSIYFFSFFKSRYHLFSTVYNSEFLTDYQ